MSAPDRRAMIERPGKDLSVRRQCVLLSLTRSGVYRSKPVAGADDLAVMRRIDELHLELPFYGSRRMTFELNKEGRGVNRKRVRRLMRVMGIEALIPRPGTSKAALGRKIYPYLLRGLKIVEPNHVWAADVTYIPMACGFLYLVAIIDWASRAVLAWQLSNTNDASFCAAALEEALLRFGKPRIFDTDQGSTFTAEAFTSKLVTAGVEISMDGRGRFMDNIFIERLWHPACGSETSLFNALARMRSARRADSNQRSLQRSHLEAFVKFREGAVNALWNANLSDEQQLSPNRRGATARQPQALNAISKHAAAVTKSRKPSRSSTRVHD